MALNVQEIRGFKPDSKPYKKSDEKGLYLLVKPNGSKLWQFKYRFGGREKKMPLGAFPEGSSTCSSLRSATCRSTMSIRR